MRWAKHNFSFEQISKESDLMSYWGGTAHWHDTWPSMVDQLEWLEHTNYWRTETKATQINLFLSKFELCGHMGCPKVPTHPSWNFWILLINDISGTFIWPTKVIFGASYNSFTINVSPTIWSSNPNRVVYHF